MADLVGRELEQRALVSLFTRARRGAASAWIHGPVGIGKSAVLAWAAHCVDGMTAVRVACHPADRDHAFAALHQIVRQLKQFVPLLDDELGGSLRGLLAGRADDLQRVDVAVLELLSVASEQGVVGVFVDDLHLADHSSAEVLAFVSRRLSAEPVALVLTAAHPPEISVWHVDDVLALGGLDSASARRVAEQAGNRFDNLHREYCAGNPLLLTTTTDGEWQLPPAVEQRVRAELERVPEAAQTAVAVVALAGDLAPPTLQAALLAAGVDDADLAVAMRHGLLLPGPVLATPWLGMALPADQPAARRAHDALATATAATDPLTSLFHRVQGTLTLSDAELDAAEEAAGRLADGGRVADGVAITSRVAELHHDPYRKAAAYRRAGLYETIPGRWQPARRWFDLALTHAPDQEQRCIVQRTRSWTQLWCGATVMEVAEQLANELDKLPWQDVQAQDEMARAWASLIALYVTTDMYAAVAAAHRAPEHPLLHEDRLVTALFSLDRSVVPTLPDRQPAWSDLVQIGHSTVGIRTEMLLMSGLWAEAADEAREQVAATRRLGALVEMGPSASRQLMAECFLGLAREAFGLALTTVELMPGDGSLLASASYAASMVGSELAVEWASRCRDIGERHGLNNFTIDAFHRLGLAALAANDLTTAVEHFEQCEQLLLAHGFLNPGFAYARGDIAEAYARLGRVEDATRVIAQLEPEGFGQAWTTGMACRARGVLGVPGQFERALELLAPSPWEVARTHLAWARAEGAAAQGEHAEIALRMFDTMGALAWAQLVRRLLDGADGGPASATDASLDPLAPLSDRERTVALAVAQGLSNKQAARELFISTKTVEAHLQSIYRKLEVSSRTQLVALCLS